MNIHLLNGFCRTSEKMFHFILLFGFLFLSMGLSRGANNTTEVNTTVETTTYEPLTTDLSTLADTSTKVNTSSEATTSEPLTDGWSTPPTQPGNTAFEVNTTVGLTTSDPFVTWPIPPTPPTLSPIPNSGPGVLAMLRIAVRSTVDLSKDSPELQFLLQTIKDLNSPETNITLKSIQKVPIL